MAEAVADASAPAAGLELRGCRLLEMEASAASNCDTSPGNEAISERTCGELLRTSRQGQTGRHGHRVPGAQYAALAAWAVLLLAQYGLMRAVCHLNVPPDCRERGDPVRDLSDVHYLLFTGGFLAIFAGVHWPDRFRYIFCFRLRGGMRGLLFLAVLFLSGALWGALDLVPGLSQFSLTGLNGPNAFLMLVLAAGTVALVSWHLWVAFKHNSWSGFLAYSLSRLALAALYGSYILVKIEHQDLTFHFHHYAVAFLAAALAEFNHPISLLALACGTGIFVQGVAVYGADAILAHQTYRFSFIDGQGDRVVSPPISEEAATFFGAHCWLHEAS